MAWESIVTTLAVGAVAGLISAGVSYVFNQRGRRDTLRMEQLRDISASLATSARQMLHLMTRDGGDGHERATSLEHAHASVRINCDLLSLVGNKDVQDAARLLRHHVYAIVAVADNRPDPRASYGFSVYDRTEAAVRMLLDATRKQMGLSGGVVRGFELEELTRRSMATYGRVSASTQVPA